MRTNEKRRRTRVRPVYRHPPLDGVTNILVGLSLVRRLRIGYTGPLFEIQRASDNATMNIGVVGRGAGFVDVAAVRAFCSGTTGSIKTLYDQFNGHDYVQATQSVQPTFYTGGDLIWIGGVPFMEFDGVNDGLTNSNIGLTASTSPDLTVASVVRRNAGGAGNTLLNIGGNSSSGKCFVYSVTTTQTALSYSGANQDLFNVGSTNPTAMVFRHGLNQNLNADRCRASFADVTPASTQSQTMSLQNASSRFGGQVNSVGSAVFHIAADSNVLVIANNDVSGRELECLERCLAMHLAA